ncbi:hypothetical protein OJF2_05740 [Aquisphaera giovannonii]|uniref:Bro-N domain-containing protein n=1 Tax=Aquisphaera giovannonii TaxID=406548 RepID=A0A5B9VWF1_9BACT|nr:BRO family protein [Aquisphaera giovannonii]QEH32105.1 hypothetical protein OJF2_05740 [Aquisphaera giovannonii]
MGRGMGERQSGGEPGNNGHMRRDASIQDLAAAIILAPQGAIAAAAGEIAAGISSFLFDGVEIRVIMWGGRPWFVAADVCRPLDIRNSRTAILTLDEDEKMTVANTYSHSGSRGGPQSLQVVSESGLYALIFKSRKPQAKRVRRWVTDEVLPAIRRTGSYGAPGAIALAERGAHVEPAAAASSPMMALFHHCGHPLRGIRRGPRPRDVVFPIRDVCHATGSPRLVTSYEFLSPDQRMTVDVPDRTFDDVLVDAVTSMGVYVLFGKSRSPGRYAFIAWFTNVVLPAIRAHDEGGPAGPEVLEVLREQAKVQAALAEASRRRLLPRIRRPSRPRSPACARTWGRWSAARSSWEAGRPAAARGG